MKTRLVNYREGEINLSFSIDRPRVTIGRAADNMIQLPDEKISKHHGVILRSGEGWTIEDLQSRNGVFVNGQRTARTDLRDGDRVKIGSYEFYFETNVPYDDFVPSYVIDVSTRANDRTLSDESKPGKS